MIEVVEMVNVTMLAATANETAPKTKAEIKAEAKAAKQVRAWSAAASKSSVRKQNQAIDRGGPCWHGHHDIFAVAVDKHQHGTAPNAHILGQQDYAARTCQHAHAVKTLGATLRYADGRMTLRLRGVQSSVSFAQKAKEDAKKAKEQAKKAKSGGAPPESVDAAADNATSTNATVVTFHRYHRS